MTFCDRSLSKTTKSDRLLSLSIFTVHFVTINFLSFSTKLTFSVSVWYIDFSVVI